MWETDMTTTAPVVLKIVTKAQELVVWVFTTITIESDTLYLLHICQHIILDMLIAIVSKMSS